MYIRVAPLWRFKRAGARGVCTVLGPIARGTLSRCEMRTPTQSPDASGNVGGLVSVGPVGQVEKVALSWVTSLMAP